MIYRTRACGEYMISCAILFITDTSCAADDWGEGVISNSFRSYSIGRVTMQHSRHFHLLGLMPL